MYNTLMYTSVHLLVLILYLIFRCTVMDHLKAKGLICAIIQFFHYIDESMKSHAPTVTTVV